MTRALIVEDKPENLYLLRTLLQAHGHEVEEARHGAEALLKARAAPPQIVISDLLMPVMDGYTLLRQWKADARLQAIPFVVYTATYTDPRDERLALDLGADAFILKPAEPAAFMLRIDEVLARQRRGELPAAHPLPGEDESQLAQYSEVLVRKLEERSFQLEQANRELREDIARRERAEADVARLLAESERARAALLGILEDERAAQAAVQESEARYRAFFDHSLDAILLTSPDGRIHQANAAACAMFGRSERELCALDRSALVDVNDPRLRPLLELRARTGRAIGELTMWRADGSAFPAEISSAVFRDREGSERTSMIIRDISERKRAGDALRASEQRFRLAASTGDVWEADITAGHGLIPAHFKQLLGYEDHEIENTVEAFAALVHPEDRARWQNAIRDHLVKRLPYELEYRARCKSGEYRWFATRGQAAWDESGRATYMAGTVFEITERKRAEEALRESEMRFRQLTENIDEVFWLTDPAKNAMLYINPAYARIWGRSCESLYASPRDWVEAIHPADRERVLDAALKKQIAGTYDEEYRIVRPDGGVRWIRDRAFPVRDAAGAVQRVAGVAQDVTLRRQSEEALRESEAKLRRLIDGTGPAIFIGLLTPDGVLVEANRPALAAGGLLREEVLGRPFWKASWWSWSEAVQRQLRSAIGRAAAGEPSRFDVQVRLAEGRLAWIDFSLEPLRDEGGAVVYLVPSAMVIDERKRAEDTLRESERRMATLIGNLPGVAYRCRNDRDYTTEFVSEGMSALTGFPAADFREHRRHVGQLIHPDDQAAVWDMIQGALRERLPWEVSYRLATASGDLKWVWERGQGICDATGELVALEGFVTDITERRHAEEALREHEALLRSVLETLPVGVWITDEKGNIVYGNTAGRRIWAGAKYVGIEQFGEYKGWWVASGKRIEPGEWALARAITRGETSLEEEIDIECFDGSRKTILNSAVPLRNADGQITGAIVVNQDITGRRQAQLAIRESEEKLRLFVDHAPSAIAMFDRDMRYLAWSRRWLADYGLGDQDLTGRSHYEVFPDLPEGWKAVHRRCLAGAVEKAEEDPFPRADGTTDWVRWEVHPWRGTGGAIGGIILFSEVVSARKRAEDALREASERMHVLSARLLEVQEAERAALARELHDEIGQSLTALKLNIQGVAKGAGRSHAERLQKTVEIADRTLAQVRALSLDLRPPQLDDLGLAAALRASLARLFPGDRPRAALEVAGDLPPLPPALASTCFRIAQEAATNAARHAQARTVSVLLAPRGGRIELEVRDDGRGFDWERMRREASERRSMGLLSMEERARLAGGTLEIVTGPGGGTRVRASLPLVPPPPANGDQVLNDLTPSTAR